ncbi:hypothetical protein RSOL_219840 [Rhizoctonia solani AG-3 Rhs1AP]|uniref:Uncharacterized protein n=1 Tax=Rhizoctonia solani AG-3 Rhs1AP TaxID=1086054 RepID=X8J767_9AGAM|nr:hypothetical protein RSOL_219840 [Rhizoctonia solani AG-3 Rhs1AP]
MVHTPRQPAFIQIVPLASCPPGTHSTSFGQPSLDRPHSVATAFGSQAYATAPRRHSYPSVGMEPVSSGRGYPGYRPADCERRASNPNTSSYPYLPAGHETHVQVRSTRFEVTSPPQRKAHYIPATPPRPPQRVPTPPGLNIPCRQSNWDPYPSPPNSPPSECVSSPRKYVPEAPKQSYMPSPPPSPRRRSTPAPKPRVSPPSPSSEDDMKDGDELLSKFRRFALAARETPSDEKCIEDLMDSYDDLMPSLIEEVAVDPRAEYD